MELSSDLDLSGKPLGDYWLLRRLGRGGMADVYLAEQTSLKRHVAVKVLRRELAGDDSYIKRFHREAQAAAALVHANIVQIYQVGMVDGLHFIAQEYVAGENLREWMARHGMPDAATAMSIVRQVASALAKAADHGIVHRDIKPENILLAKGGEVKVADFGLARLSGRDEGLNLTQAGVTMGTPLYMSPEQVEGRPLDARSDIYSLGVTCYHMLAGEPPFRGETALGVAVQHLRTTPERLDTLRPDVPSALCRIVHKMLAKEPAQRYQHGREILRELRTIQPPEGAGASAEQGWDTETLAGDATPVISATSELDSLMKTQSLLVQDRGWRRWLIAGVTAAFLVGGVIAYVTRDGFLLASPEPATGVTRLDDAQKQYRYALLAGDNEAAWRAVFEYHGEDTEYAPLARQQLAELYLQRGQFDLALPLFEQLAKRSERQYRTFGLTGQAVIHFMQGDNDLLAMNLLELDDITNNLSAEARAQLLNPHMMQLLEKIYEQRQQQQAESARTAMDRLLGRLGGSDEQETTGKENASKDGASKQDSK